jgi:D-amino-acid oxidase
MAAQNSEYRIAVIGAGVIGLTNALQLQRQGYKVTIYSSCFPNSQQSHLLADPAYTSSKGGAHWFSFAESHQLQQQLHDQLSYHALMGLAVLYPPNNPSSCGVSQLRGHAVFEANYSSAAEKPWWAKLAQDFTEYSARELEELNKTTGKLYIKGYHYKTAMINVVKYLPWLLAEFQREGGLMIQQKLSQLLGNSQLSGFNYVINCTGIGARELAQDSLVYPCRGRTILVKQPEITEIWREKGAKPIYILPRGDGTVVCGGTYEDNNWNLGVEDKEAEEEIWRSVTKLVPALKGAQILSQSCGLRPGRKGGPRFEWDQQDGRIFHCYGHHGYGFQASW